MIGRGNFEENFRLSALLRPLPNVLLLIVSALCLHPPLSTYYLLTYQVGD